MKQYHGTIPAPGEWRVRIWEDGQSKPLPIRLDLRNHSPTGFSWGYHGSGPAQLALAILADHLDDRRALAFYQEFKRLCIARIPQDRPFVLSSGDVEWKLGHILEYQREQTRQERVP